MEAAARQGMRGQQYVQLPLLTILPKPSRISAFNQYVKLSGLLAQAAKTTHISTTPPTYAHLRGRNWLLETTRQLLDAQDPSTADGVAELDSALIGWYNALPEHCNVHLVVLVTKLT